VKERIIKKWEISQEHSTEQQKHEQQASAITDNLRSERHVTVCNNEMNDQRVGQNWRLMRESVWTISLDERSYQLSRA